jgi:predicted transcriptional regulator of viral defense system
MKYREILIEQLKSLPYFNKGTIYQLSEQYGLKKGTVDAYISRSLARKDLIQLKNGLYITAYYYDKNKSDVSYTFYLANILRQPSYVSSWTALQYYSLATEAIHTVTSVTPKITRSYNNKAGNFAYHSIKRDLFSDFSLTKGTFDFFIASPSKALFDLLYFKTNQFRGFNFEEILKLVYDLRIDIDEMEEKERDNFYAMIKKYLK